MSAQGFSLFPSVSAHARPPHNHHDNAQASWLKQRATACFTFPSVRTQVFAFLVPESPIVAPIIPIAHQRKKCLFRGRFAPATLELKRPLLRGTPPASGCSTGNALPCHPSLSPLLPSAKCPLSDLSFHRSRVSLSRLSNICLALCIQWAPLALLLYPLKSSRLLDNIAKSPATLGRAH